MIWDFLYLVFFRNSALFTVGYALRYKFQVPMWVCFSIILLRECGFNDAILFFLKLNWLFFLSDSVSEVLPLSCSPFLLPISLYQASLSLLSLSEKSLGSSGGCHLFSALSFQNACQRKVSKSIWLLECRSDFLPLVLLPSFSSTLSIMFSILWDISSMDLLTGLESKGSMTFLQLEHSKTFCIYLLVFFYYKLIYLSILSFG